MQSDTLGDATPLVLGTAFDSFGLTGIRYESDDASDPDWLSVDLIVCRAGERFETTSAFMNTGDLFGLAQWFKQLLVKGATEPGSASHAQSGPAYFFEDPLELEALSWSADGAKLRFRWGIDPPWNGDELAEGTPSLVVLATSAQMTTMVEALGKYDDLLPRRDDQGPDWQTGIAVSVLATLLILIVVGAITVVRWMASLF